MADETALDANVETFLRRALPHFLAGKSVEDSMRAVLNDDERLATSLFKRGQSHYFPTPDERGRSYHDGVKVGDVIACEITGRVYRSLRCEKAA